MGVRSGVALALVASALLGFTVAVPQDADLGVAGGLRFTGKGANVGDANLVRPGDRDAGSPLDRVDGRGVDPDLAKNLDREALAGLLGNLTAEQLGSLGMDKGQAAATQRSLRDPTLSEEELERLMQDLADRGLAFVNGDDDGRFDGGETAFADLDGDGRVSAGDVRLGALAALASRDRGLDPGARSLLEAFQAAGGVGLANPFGARDRATATAATAPMGMPLPYPSDRAGGPLAPVCVQLYAPSLTCHQRTFAQSRVAPHGNHYLFHPAPEESRTAIALEPDAVGVRSKGFVHLLLDPLQWTPVPGVTPADRLVSIAGPSIELARDGNGMAWARGPAGEATVTLVWAVDLSYFDLTVPASASIGDVPRDLAPVLDPPVQAVGLRIASLAGADGRDYGASLRALAQHIRGFGIGPLPDRDARADDLLAVAEAQVGCARQRSEVFVLAAQSLGIPARLIVNEAHAFAEAWVPAAGWRMVDLGGCGRYQVAARAGHPEVMVRQGLPFAAGQAPPSQEAAGVAAGGNATPVAAIDITESPDRLRKNAPFTIAGTVASSAGPVPAGVPITFTYNRTKSTPGTAFCSTQTTGEAAYRATCQLGPDTPAGSLQLVARLAPTLVAGRPSDAAYSDPPFMVQKATRLAIEGPARTAAAVPLAYLVRLLDEEGAPVPYAPVTLRLDDGAAQSASTDRDGRALFTLQAGRGPHRLEAAFAGSDSHDRSAARLDVEAAATSLTAAVDADALRQGGLRVAGTLAGPAGQAVGARWRSAPDAHEEAREARTDATGAYSILFSVPPPAGIGLVIVQGPDGVAVAAGFTREVAGTAALGVPARWQAGAALPVSVTLSGSPTPLPLTLLADGEVAARAVVPPGAPTVLRIELGPGAHTLEVRPEPGTQLATEPRSVQAGRFEAQLDPVPTLAPGARLEMAGTLLFEGAPAEGEEIALRVLDARAAARSGGDGRFHLGLLLPAGLPAGNATALLEAPGVGLQQDVALRIQRAARLAIDAPALSFRAFGSTPVAVRGEGVLQVRVGGIPADAGLLAVATGTLLLRTVRIDAAAQPTEDGVAPSSLSHDIVVVNPLTLVALPATLTTGATLGARARRRIRLARAHRHRLLPRPQRIRARVLRPELPPAVPRVLDPALDPVLELRMRRKGGWVVRDGRGRPLPATVEGRMVTIPTARLAPGVHQLRLERGRRAVVVPVAVQGLRSALDDATRHLLQRLDGSQGFVTMEHLESALRAAGADSGRAQEVRRRAEEALYAGPRCSRASFHAFFEALDRAQAGP